MKKIILVAILAIVGVVSSSASDITTSLGANFLYGTKFSQKGLGVSYKMGFSEHFRLAPELQYFFRNKNMKAWDANANLEYVQPLFDKCQFYPFVGFSYSHWTQNVNIDVPNVDKAVRTFDRIGGNIGVGIEYDITSQIGIVAELRGQIMKNYSQCLIGVGLKYTFE